ncbi:MAG: hypothetical protein A6F71_08840 [Cycloclasticus sp. symbiont of Poecilosclerida sp. M]|nr:MAG: hypothetical protein A6F71_08840 [Cycloclasticus sp. symbiont of Poecilosclerida sp. M]
MESLASEKGPLLPVVVGHQKSCISKRVCIQSKAARLILLWNFSVLLAYKTFYDTNTYIQVSQATWLPILLPTTFTFIAVLSPVAGLLTDVKFSRVKAVLCTSYAVLVKVIVLFIVTASIIIIFSLSHGLQKHPAYILDTAVLGMLSIMVTVYMVFIINGIQFGMDQLHDSPTEDSILFIHWYVWINYTCSLITQVAWNFLLYGGYY